MITFPRIDRDLLILHPSFNLSPIDLVDFYLSDPAKSTKWNLEDLIWVIPSLSYLLSIWSVKTEWDLELSLFIDVSATWRL